ncbi:YlbL family protein [Umezawaea beigongshangensis]|uniref:YlbL family protein n=1 Tax=Umezawaea beigongshangensis TaxID=2780383 RepID=UPI0027DB1050|nr:PDZ domain-containing protein [Umezawaea beigongshangensis]
MSERSEGSSGTGTDESAEQHFAGASAPVPPPRSRGLTRRTWTLVTSFVLVTALGLLGGFARVPYIALGPGPTYDTLGQVEGTDVVRVDGEETFPTGGALTMTTVSLTDDVSLFGALGLWLSGRYALAPREEYFKPGESEEQVEQENVRAFQDSQSSAEVSALSYLGYPKKVVVAEVTEDSPAEGVLSPDDRVVAVNGRQIASADDVRTALAETRPGDRADVTFERGTEEPRTTSVVLGSSEGRENGFIGILPADRADVPFEVTISLADVGGPSAGLMFALSIVDKLTPGELNGGQSIAGTGEIDDRGQVGPIGGIQFKMTAAREGGATTFLVPAANCTEAKQQTPEGLRLIRVENLTGAVQALEALTSGGDVPGC